jgi:NAD(P)-dependent dehydrogenase (short-subunit alcohol dehydrogenase family)
MTTYLTASAILKEGNTAVITGASSGIGRATAMYCAAQGMTVWMADIDKDELAAARKLVETNAASSDQVRCNMPLDKLILCECSSPHSHNLCALFQKIQAVVTDVSDQASVVALAERVFANDGKCHFLMNNAGTGLGGGAMTDMDVVHRVMGVNAFGPMHGCLAFVPRMHEPGIIVNTGSKQGITMPPGNLTYNMSKAALKAYTEGLEHELRQEGKLRAALLVPGWVNTSILLKTIRSKDNATLMMEDESCVPFHEDKPASGGWMPSQVVEFMVQELDKGRFYIICPDNDVDRETDNLRMTWAMQDITQDRPPLSRWHPDYKEKFAVFLETSKPKSCDQA